MSRRIYLRHPSRDDVVSIATGFNWSACLLGPLWAIAKRQWLIGVWLLAGNAAIAWADAVLAQAGVSITLGSVISLVSTLVFAAFCGYNANRWHLRALKRKGYQVV
ncbi:DUF2628 domain-containing protein [Burkholderia sp. Ac-20353]|uniref:DUF2628 domain-containing protein n=1 Tax=Burkholderia sp. Ac-20353 TaxID=2703894 RepID=UPI00197BA974|nr:DUF2628 domain-containing protein [Burkholderia sp. Ac-20353]MBN3786749.1 DUF2628 domain-containing protein [Burkholderia sp. Ac-20353]